MHFRMLFGRNFCFFNVRFFTFSDYQISKKKKKKIGNKILFLILKQPRQSPTRDRSNGGTFVV